jgi:F-type H+-transporting ATPase subunit delta
MEELIAKRYIKALKESSDMSEITSIASLFEALSLSFKDEKFIGVVGNPEVSSKEKEALLLEAVKPANSQKVNNFIKLLVENKRVQIIPAIAQELKKDIAKTTKTYSGVVCSDSNIDSKMINQLAAGLSKKFDSTIALEFIKNDFNGIKVEVEGLGIEINFSKSRIDSQIIEHIVKAI